MLSTPQTVVTEYARMLFFVNGAAMNLPVKSAVTGTTMRSPLALYSFLMAWWGYWDLKQRLADLCRRSGDVGD